MVCPVCQCEAVITRIVYSEEDGKRERTNTYSCRNKRCRKFNKEIGEETKEVQPNP